MVATFQHALLLVNVSLITVVLAGAGVALAGIWLQLGRAGATPRSVRSALVIAAAAIVTAGAVVVPGYWDASESRQNSFPEPAEEALHALPAPLPSKRTSPRRTRDARSSSVWHSRNFGARSRA